MAAPHVTGAAALLLGAGLSAIEVIARLSATAVTNKVADPKGSLNRLLHTAPGDLSWLPQTPDRTVRIEAVTAAIGTPTAQGGRLSAQVIVRDAATGMPVPGVIVNGDWVVGPWNMGVVSALSGSRGMTMITGPFYRGSGSARFCVKSVSGAAVLVADQELTCASTSNLPPVAVIEADTTNGTSPLPVTFSATSSHDPDGKSLHYEWRFGDGVAHTGPRVTHTYGRPGNYTALLYVTDAYGATSKRAWTVVVAAGDQALTPVAPLRLLDTRSGTPVTPLPNQKKPVEAGETLRLELDGIAGVSIRDAAVVLNVTAVNAADTGFVTVFPCGLRPLASNLNTHAGAVVANQVIAALSPEADVCLYSSARLDLVIDITGVLRSGRGFTPVSPVRVVDSRVSETAPGRLPAATLLPGDIFEIDLAGIAGNPGGSNAAALNVTAVNAAVGGFLTVYPCGQRPLASNVNVAAGKVAANFVLASLSTDQRVCVYSSTRTDVVIDVSGWFAQHAGLVTFSPGRVLDTRIKDPGNSPYAGSVTYVDLLQDTTVIGGDTVFTDPLVAPGAASVALNVTVVAGHTAGFVTVYPCSNERPLASNVNFSPGQIVANAVVVPIHPTGVVCVYSSAAIELVVDVNGWFAA
jgi:PKD repeat protein